MAQESTSLWPNQRGAICCVEEGGGKKEDDVEAVTPPAVATLVVAPRDVFRNILQRSRLDIDCHGQNDQRNCGVKANNIVE